MANIFRFNFGDFSCTVLKDSSTSMSADDAFAQADETERAQALANSTYDPAAIALSMNVLVLEKEGQRIMIETGNSANDPENAQLFAALEEANIDPLSIDIVTISHAHADHYSGMLDADGNKRFPNAQYVMWADEWQHYSSDNQMVRELERGQARHDFIKHYLGGLAPYLDLITPENDCLIDGIRMIPAQGHTHHHVRFEVQSQGQTMHVLGDAFIHPLCLDYPEWTFPFDALDEQAIATRKSLRDIVGTDLVMVYHFGFPGVGYVRRQDGRYTWEML